MLKARISVLAVLFFPFTTSLDAAAQERPETSIDKVSEALDTGDFKRALELATPLAEQGDVTAQRSLGQLYVGGPVELRNPQQAAKWFKRAAEQGDDLASFYLGLLYSAGLGVEKDEHAAVRYWESLALAGDAESAFELGKLYDPGYFEGEAHRISLLGREAKRPPNEVRDDASVAVKWYRIAANAGAPGAQHNLGNKYAHGEGVPLNYEEAARYFRQAARKGTTLSQTNLGAMYAQGKGVKKDVVRAYMWSSLAASSGEAQAQFNLEEVVREMTASQVGEAQRLAKTCMETSFSDQACQ